MTPVAAVPAGPSQHDLAVEAFERGFQALQRRQFGRAAESLTSVVKNYPDEKELQERARVYLSICARQAAAADQTPQSFDDRINAATVAINRGAYDEGLVLLNKLEVEEPASDHVHYMLSVVHTLKGNLAGAMQHLRKAVESNAEYRYLASQDADLEPLRQDGALAAVLAVPPVRRRAAARKR